LKVIERESKVRAVVDQTLMGKKVTAKFENRDIEAAIRELLKTDYFILLFSSETTTANQELKEVRAKGDVVSSKSSKGQVATLVIPYGEGIDEVGTISLPEGPSVGPMSFAIGEDDTVYIADSVNKRVQVYSSSGAHLMTIPLSLKTMAADIVVDKRGYIYIYDRSVRKLYQFTKSGNIVTSVDVDEGFWGGGGTMHISNNEIFMYACDSRDCADYKIADISPNHLFAGMTAGSNKVKDKGRHGLSGNKYMTRLKRFERGELDIIGKDGLSSETLSFPLKDIVSLQFLGEDKQGKRYIKTERKGDGNKVLTEIQKFSANDDYLSTTILSATEDFYVPNREYLLNRDGSVYRLLPEKDRLRIEIIAFDND
jgi:hypothetical protein